MSYSHIQGEIKFPNRGKITVACVDPDKHFSSNLKKLLDEKGYGRVEPFTSFVNLQKGFTALDEEVFDSRRTDFDVVTLELGGYSMDADGITLMSQLAENKSRGGFIVLTKYGVMDTLIKAMELGACDYLIKPIGVDELCAKIDEAYVEKLYRINCLVKRGGLVEKLK